MLLMFLAALCFHESSGAARSQAATNHQLVEVKDKKKTASADKVLKAAVFMA